MEYNELDDLEGILAAHTDQLMEDSGDDISLGEVRQKARKNLKRTNRYYPEAEDEFFDSYE